MFLVRIWECERTGNMRILHFGIKCKYLITGQTLPTERSTTDSDPGVLVVVTASVLLAWNPGSLVRGHSLLTGVCLVLPKKLLSSEKI